MSRGGDLHGEEEKKRHTQRERESTAQVLVSISGLFIYSLLSGFLPPTPAADSR